MKKKISLRTAWYGLIALITLLPMLILFPWIGSKSYSLLLESVMVREALLNEEIKAHVEYEVSRIITLLQNNSDLMAYTLLQTRNKRLLNELLESVISRENTLHSLTVLNRQGRVIQHKHRQTHSKSDPPDHGVALHPPTVDPAAPDFIIPLYGRNYVGPPFSHEGGSMFHIAIPVGPMSHPSAVLQASINTEELWQKIHSKLSRRDIITYLVDSRGSQLTQPPGSKNPAGTLLTHLDIVRALITYKDWNRTETYVGLNGTRVFGVATFIDALNWGVVSEIPAKKITGPIFSTLVAIVVCVSVIVIPFFGIGLWLVHRMLKPITKLTGAFDHVSRGDYSQNIPPSPVKELNTLVTGFNHMISEINQREGALRKSEKSLVIFRQFAEASGQGLVMTTLETKVTYVNPTLYRLLGEVKAEDTYAKSLVAYYPEEMRHRLHYKIIPAVMHEGQWTGELSLLSTDGKIIPTIQNFFLIHGKDGNPLYFAGVITDITARKHCEEKLEILAATDNLTQAYNRSKFEEIMKREVKWAKRYNEPLSIMGLDLDHFKEVNDGYGHIVGDYVLKTTADIFRKSLRETDYLVRWGGEEFIVIAPRTDLERTKVLAERLRKTVEHYRFDKVGRVTVSFGVTQFRKDDTEDSFLKRMDDALYKAKNSGRNRVKISV